MTAAIGLYYHAYNYCLSAGIEKDRLDWVKCLPYPEGITDKYFLGELAWCVFNAGMKEELIRRKWPALQEAFRFFSVNMVRLSAAKVRREALMIINHPGKVEAVITAARRIFAEGPIGAKLAVMTIEEALAYLQTFPFIGPVTRYHLARNIGFDVVKPDRHIVRITEFFGYDDCDAFVGEIAAQVLEPKGHVDFILWQWLALAGPGAYEEAAKFR